MYWKVLGVDREQGVKTGAGTGQDYVLAQGTEVSSLSCRQNFLVS